MFISYHPAPSLFLFYELFIIHHFSNKSVYKNHLCSENKQTIQKPNNSLSHVLHILAILFLSFDAGHGILFTQIFLCKQIKKYFPLCYWILQSCLENLPLF